MNVIIEIDGVRHKRIFDTTESSNRSCDICSLKDLCCDWLWVYGFCLNLADKEGMGHFIKEQNNETH